MRIYSLKDFEKCTREQIKHYLKRWNVPFNSKSSTEVLRRKAMRSFQKEVIDASNTEQNFLL